MVTACVHLGSPDISHNDYVDDDQFEAFLKSLAADDGWAPLPTTAPAHLDSGGSNATCPAASAKNAHKLSAVVGAQIPSVTLPAASAADAKREREREKNRRKAAAYRERCRVCLYMLSAADCSFFFTLFLR